MKRFMRICLVDCLVFGLLLFSPLAEISSASPVCGSGINEPPFLSYGVKSNLLLMIDNSGSLLDMAYSDDRTYTSVAGTEYQNICFDESYLMEDDGTGTGTLVGNVNKVYSGNFESDSWYLWTEPMAWPANDPYSVNDIVSRNGNLYRAILANTGIDPETDNGIVWDRLGAGTVPEWTEGTGYADGRIVIYNGMLFRHNSYTATALASPYTLFDERDASDHLVWDRLDEGYFAKSADEPCTSSFEYLAAPGTADERKDLQITFAYDTATPPNPTDVTCFAATGNFINWASASKFDIQKKILTGGKFYEGYEARDASGNTDNSVITDIGDDRLISEHRGCSGKGFTKQITLNRDGAGNTVTQTLVMRVRGAKEQLDASDFTTRIEIVGTNATGGVNFDRCHDYLAYVEAGTPPNNAVDTAMQDCLYADNTPTNEAYHVFQDSLHGCWKIASGKDPNHWGDLQTKCENIYQEADNGYDQKDPWIISPWDDEYLCYGMWDSADPVDPAPADYNADGTGYFGRCWADWPVAASGDPCNQKKCNGDLAAEGWTFIDKYGYFKNVDGIGQTCSAGTGGVQSACPDGEADLSRKGECPGKVPYGPVFVLASDNTTSCEISAGGDERSGRECYDTDEQPGGCWAGDTDFQKECAEQAERDYCGGISVPDVIDPSDLPAATDGAVWGISAALIDSGVYSQMGVERPLSVMKGYVKYELPPEQTTDDLARPDGPRGVLFDNADDLKIGVMSFRENGSKYECDTFNATCTRDPLDSLGRFYVCNEENTDNYDPDACTYCTARQSIGNYCDGEVNNDGAELLAPVQLGQITDANGENWGHYIDIVTKVNDTRATAWTPLAEAMFSAIGYFTRNTAFCLEDQDGNCTGDEFGLNTSDDPIEYWCQENHIIVITEGESTSDINSKVSGFVNNPASPFVVDKRADEPVSDNAGDDENGACSGLEGSTYFDDMTWWGTHLGPLYAQRTMSDPDGNTHDKQNITTHIVTTGSLSTVGDGECSPKTLMEAAAFNGSEPLVSGENPDELERNLMEIFNDLRQRASAGSAASVISSARGGEGAIYQAIFWPEKNRTHADGTEYIVDWTGDVHALFIDTHGFMYEDTNGDRRMTPTEDINGNGTLDPGEDLDGDTVLDTVVDRRVIVYFDETAKTSRACLDTSIFTNIDGTCDSSVDLSAVNFLWSAAGWLNDNSLNTVGNRSTYLTGAKKRYIYTWNDLNNDGIVDVSQDAANEWLPFVAGTDWAGLSVDGTRGSVPKDFDVAVSADNAITNAEVDDIVKWIRGEDRGIVDANNDGDFDDAGDFDYPLRSRQIPSIEGGSTLVTQRLADVIHSTPMTVSSPAEGFHLIYNDFSYAEFVARWKQRRHMIYYGANDGMLHAVNAGFYVEQQKRFCLSSQVDNDGNCDESSPPTDGFPALGQEMWAYVPYNLLPHLKCLTDVGYKHKYYVDLRPRIFDVQIFPTDDAHPNGWGTILVGGMRFGGVPVDAEDLTGANSDGIDDPRQFISSYFVFDITDPETSPVLLGEMTRYRDSGDLYTDTDGNGSWSAGDVLNTDLDGDGTYDAGQDLDGDSIVDWHADLGQSSNISTMVIMKKSGAAANTSNNQWYLILGSGPHGPDAMKGVSDQHARVAVLPLDWMVTTNTTFRKALRIPGGPPTATEPGGTLVLSDSSNGFTSDLITIDGDINPSRLDYMADAVYFGTVEGNFATKGTGETYWNGGGRLYRLLTRQGDASGDLYFGRGINQEINTPDDWTVNTLINAERPITAAASVGYDGYNFWVYFGTGRFFDPDDKTDDTQQSFYGIKEPMMETTYDHDTDSTTPDITVNKFLATEVVSPTVHGVPPASRTWPDGTQIPGAKGLLKVDEIRVAQALTPLTATLSCRDDASTDCIPEKPADGTKLASLEDLIQYIAGQNDTSISTDDWHNSADGWYIDFFPYGNRERNLGQATLLGGLITFTTYQPYSDRCRAEGRSYLYGVYYQTGTAWHEPIFDPYGLYSGGDVREKLDIGRGLASTPNLHVSGDGDKVTAFLQTSTGEIKEIKEDNLPIDNYSTGRSKWKECTQ